PRHDNFRVAWPFTLIDTAGQSQFTNRWAEWFALASRRELRPQTQTAPGSAGTWRHTRSFTTSSETADEPTSRQNMRQARSAARPGASLDRPRSPILHPPGRPWWRQGFTWMVAVIIATVVTGVVWAGNYFYHYSDPKPGNAGIVIDSPTRST